MAVYYQECNIVLFYKNNLEGNKWSEDLLLLNFEPCNTYYVIGARKLLLKSKAREKWCYVKP